MKTEEDEAFDELARRQGDWGGGFQAKRQMAADKLQEPVCDKDPQGCWNVRCQLGKQCKNLAQPAQEPEREALKLALKALTSIDYIPCCTDQTCQKCKATPQPAQQREWVGLTDEEVELYWDWEDWQTGAGRSTIFEMVRDIEAKLKERNG
jgi:hypothetical protein